MRPLQCQFLPWFVACRKLTKRLPEGEEERITPICSISMSFYFYEVYEMFSCKVSYLSHTTTCVSSEDDGLRQEADITQKVERGV